MRQLVAPGGRRGLRDDLDDAMHAAGDPEQRADAQGCAVERQRQLRRAQCGVGAWVGAGKRPLQMFQLAPQLAQLIDHGAGALIGIEPAARAGGIVPEADVGHLGQHSVALEHLPIVVAGRLQRDAILGAFTAGPHPARRPLDNLADLEAQIAANHAGARLVAAAMGRTSPATFLAHMAHVQAQAAALVARAVAALPAGTRRFADALDDGAPIVVTVTATGERLAIDFTGSAPAHAGNLNAPRAVTMAAVIYVVRALVGAPIPLNAGCLAAVDVVIPPGSILDPPPGAAVVAGNVETSQRIVDVLLGALGLAAASQGTMNNLTLGGADWAYYETIGGGAGATPHAPGASAVHTHMTNTRITDAEVLEARFPVRVERFAIRRGSGGDGRHRGGDGVVRTLRLLAPAEVALVTERRTRPPFGLDGGAPGARGHDLLDGALLPGRAHVRAPAGATITVETPGGGGCGAPPPKSQAARDAD